MGFHSIYFVMTLMEHGYHSYLEYKNRCTLNWYVTILFVSLGEHIFKNIVSSVTYVSKKLHLAHLLNTAFG